MEINNKKLQRTWKHKGMEPIMFFLCLKKRINENKKEREGRKVVEKEMETNNGKVPKASPGQMA